MNPKRESDPIRGNQWIQNLLESAKPFKSERDEEQLISSLLNTVYQQNDHRGPKLAAAFDLLIAAEYYRSVAHVGWLYCPEEEPPLLLYPYTNACPSCVLQGKFVYHKANKPKSGSIGVKTSRLLALFLQRLFERKGLSIEVLKGREPVDVIFVDRSTTPHTVMFAEIKAAPLVTLPIAVESQKLTIEADDQIMDVPHRVTDHVQLFGSPMNIFVPVQNKNSWNSQLFALGSKDNAKDTTWAYRGVTQLLNTSHFWATYFEFWQAAYLSYAKKNQSAIYWLTNACGQPKPRPADWPRRRGGTGFESISDSKTSVGMDRTDDLKKATYQVLKIGAEGKPASDFVYKVGLLSNMHAIRHFDDYLLTLKDIIWTRDATGEVTHTQQLPIDTPMFNLFDGIISLTETYVRDEWIRRVFDF